MSTKKGLTNGGKWVDPKAKEARGTWRADRDEGKVSLPVLQETPTPPEEWDEEQKQNWYVVCTQLQQVGLLHSVGLPMLKIYVRELGIYDKATKDIEDNGVVVDHINSKGEVVTKLNPAVMAANAAFNKIVAVASHFGFTPAAATRIKVPGKVEDNTDPDFGF